MAARLRSMPWPSSISTFATTSRMAVLARTVRALASGSADALEAPASTCDIHGKERACRCAAGECHKKKRHEFTSVPMLCPHRAVTLQRESSWRSSSGASTAAVCRSIA